MTVFLISSAGIIFAAVIPAFSQQPTDEQRSALRSQCRSDYMAHCASVPPGGLQALQCLQKNMSSLSLSCQSAVKAIEPPAAAPKAESAPDPVHTPSSSPPPAASSPPAPSPAAPEKAEPPAAAPKPSASPKAAASPPAKKPGDTKSAPAPAATAGPGTALAPTPALTLRPMRPVEELMVLRSACGADARMLCAAVPPGGGRIVQCLASQAGSLSPACKDVLAQFSAQ